MSEAAVKNERVDLGHATPRLSQSTVDDFANALGLAGEDTSPFDTALVPTLPMTFLAAGEIGETLHGVLSSTAGNCIHTTQTFHYSRPLPVDTDLRCNGSLSWSTSAAIPMATIDLLVGLASGDSVCSVKTDIAVLPSLRDVEAAKRASYAQRSRHAHILASRSSQPLNQEVLRTYARVSGDDNPIHLDPDAARNAGLSSTIVPGMLIMGQMGYTAARLAGGTTLKSLQAAFVAPLHCGTTVTTECWGSASAAQDARLPKRVKIVAHDGNDGLVAVGSCTING